MLITSNKRALPINDKIAMRGDISIRVFSADSLEELRRIEIRNKITFLAADVICSLLMQRSGDYGTHVPVADVSNDQIYTMRMGTSTAAAVRSDQNLGAPWVGAVIGDAGKGIVMPGEMVFVVTLQAGDGNGAPSALAEAGLFTKGDGVGTLDSPGSTVNAPRLFARQTHPPITKTNAIVLEYTWRIAFTA